MSEHPLEPLGSICEINPDTLTEASDPTRRYRYIDLSSIKEQKADLSITPLPFAVLPSRARRRVAFNDVLLGTVRPNLKNFAIIDSEDEDLLCSTGFAVLRSKANTSDPRFIFHAINSEIVARQLNALVTGSNYPAVNATQVGELLVPVPPLPEQKKIAEILSGIDHVTDSISRRIAKEEALFISLQHELLSGIAGAAFVLPRHHDQAIKILPVARLFEIQLGKMLNKEAKEHGHQFQYIGNKNVQQWVPDLRQLESMHFSDSERRKFELKPFDLLVCEGGDAGRCCIWERGETEIYYQKAIHRMRPINNDCLPTFMMHYLSYCKANNLLSDFISRTSISHLTREKLLEVPVALPSHQDQSSIVNKLELQRRAISKLFSKSKILKDLKTAVASDLLSGRKRVSV